MRSASETPKSEGPVRATFEIPRDLYEAFMEAAKRNDQTGSQEVRRFMREYVDADEQAAA